MTHATVVAEAISIEQARYINANLLTSVIGGFFIACVVAAVFWDVTPRPTLFIWLGANFVLAGYRLGVRHHFMRLPETFDNARRNARYSMIGTTLSGVQWGLSIFFLMPLGNLPFELLLVFAISNMAVAAMFSFGVHYPTFLAFFVPSVGGAILGLFIRGSTLEFEIGLGIAIFALVALRFVAALYRMFLRTFELRFENRDLVDQLTVEKEAAVSASLAKSRFLAAASHDLRQPMHALNLYLGTLAGMELSGNARAMVGNVRQCADTMDELFRGLLDVSRLDAGAVQTDPCRFPINELLERIRLEFAPQAQAKGLRLRVARCRAIVYSDPALVERILRNFTANALRYTERGSILIGCRRMRGQVRVAVYDTGPGIAPEHRKVIFEEFYQIANPNRDRTRGIGLGLAIVERLARLLNAALTLESQPGRGSMFAVDLPRGIGPVTTSHAQPQALRQDQVSGALVVVVDDEEPILSAMRGLLTQWGCSIVTARSGSEAIQALAASPRAPDALICDFRLADGEDGIAVIGAVCAEFNTDIPSLILTGDTGPDRLRQITASGFAVLHKPIDSNTLRLALARLLEPAHSEV